MPALGTRLVCNGIKARGSPGRASARSGPSPTSALAFSETGPTRSEADGKEWQTSAIAVPPVHCLNFKLLLFVATRSRLGLARYVTSAIGPLAPRSRLDELEHEFVLRLRRVRRILFSGSFGLRRKLPSSFSLNPAASTSCRRNASSMRCKVPDSEMPVPGRPE